MGIRKGEYDIELIGRTKELIASYQGVFNLTLLMNSLLSLVILPSEHNRVRKLNYLNTDLTDFTELQAIISSKEFHFNRRGRKNDLKNLLGRIRNGIAHQRIETITTNRKWTGVIIQDIDPRTSEIGLNIKFTTRELKEFALFIATKYLEEVKNASR